MKKSIQSKLAKYTALAAATVGAQSVNGQIVYTDINDTTVSTNGGYFDLDLNQDGEPDFRFTQYLDTGITGQIDAILVAPFDSLYGRAAGEARLGFNYPYKLTPGYELSGTSDWLGIGSSGQNGYLAFQVNGVPYPNSNWKGPVVDGIMGLRIFLSDGLHYGWARLDVSSDNRSFTIKDFAFQETSDSSIIAGHLFVDLAEEFYNSISWKQGRGYVSFFKVSDDLQAVQVEVTDAQGRVIKSENWVENDYTFNTEGYPTGVYFFRFIQNGIIRTERIFIED